MFDDEDALGLRPFHAMEIMAEAIRLEAAGQSVLRMQTGEPEVPPAPAVLDAVRNALPSGQRYTHAKGALPLRRRLARFYRERHGVSVDPEAIFITMGSSSGFILTFLGAVERGERVALTRPGYPAYLNTVAAIGHPIVEIPLSPDTGWRLSARDIEEAHARQRFDALLFASPANPTGAAVTRAALGEIVQTCARLGVRLISDEIYHGLTYGEPSTSALEFTADAVIINSFSKYHAMTGWRVGWMVLPKALVRRFEMLQQNLFISASDIAQVAALAALDQTDYAEAQVSHYAENRPIMIDGLNRLGLTVAGEGGGAFYAYADASRFTKDSLDFCLRMAREAGVAATPGIDFDRTNGNRYVRFSYAGSRETILEALARLGRFLGA